MKFKTFMNVRTNLFNIKKLAATNRLSIISILQCQLKETYQISESHDNVLKKSNVRKLIFKFH